MKKLLALALIATMALGLVGCGSSDDTTSTTTESTDSTTEVADSDKPYDGVTLTFLASQDWIYDAEYDLAEQFYEETGITIDYQIVDADTYTSVLMTKLNAGEGVDLFAAQSGAFDIVTSYNVEENAVDLSGESWAGNVEELAAEQCSVDGTLYGQPIFDVTDSWVISYNKDIFDELGLEIPTTYDEFAEVCDAILAAGITPIYECVSDGWHHTLWFPETCVQVENLEAGTADLLNANEATFSGNETMTAILDEIVDMVDSGYWGDNYMANTYADQAKYFVSGEYAMTITNLGFVETVAAYDETYDTSSIGYFIMPLADNQTIGVNAACPTRFVSSSSENVEACLLYLEFLAETESLTYLTENTDRFSHLPYTNAISTYSDAKEEFYEMYSEGGTVYQTAVSYVNPQWTEIGNNISAMILGEITAEEMLQDIDSMRSQQALAAGDEAW